MYIPHALCCSRAYAIGSNSRLVTLIKKHRRSNPLSSLKTPNNDIYQEMRILYFDVEA